MPTCLTTRLTLATSLAGAALLASCAAPDLRALEAAAYASARPCCASLQALPPPAPLAGAQTDLALGPASPHFDFGQGLAPFASFRLDGTVKYLGLLSKAQGAQPFHFADLRAVFLDARGQPLPPAALTPAVVRIHGMGWYALGRYTGVPDGAATLVVTTGARSAGQSANAAGQIPGGGLMLGSTFIPLAGGLRDFPYFHALYGHGWLLANPPPSR